LRRFLLRRNDKIVVGFFKRNKNKKAASYYEAAFLIFLWGKKSG